MLAEALLSLAVARLIVVAVPFRKVGHIASRPLLHVEPSLEIRAAAIRRVRWAVHAWARRVPWRALCYEQGLTAQSMLRRRGIHSQLYFGAAPNDRTGLAAHVWVRVEDTDVVGCEIADQFAVLAVFSTQP